MNKIIGILFFLIVCVSSFAQKNAEYFLEKSIHMSAIEFQFSYYVAFQNDSNKYIQYNQPDDSLEFMLVQGKIYEKKNGEKLFIGISKVDDMQCFFYTQGLFEITKEDSLVQIPFHSLIPKFSISEFIDTAKIHQEIYPNYEKQLAEYLGEENPFGQFLEEMFDVIYVISPKNNKLTATLHYCDYMSVNIAGYSEKDTQFLTTFKKKEMKFNSKKGVFVKK